MLKHEHEPLMNKAVESNRMKPARRVRDPVHVVALDGDDTLWHNESIFSVTQDKYREMLSRYVADDEIDRTLYATETGNLRLFGYGVKGFVLSMIETAIQVSDGRVSTADIQSIIDQGKAMLDHPVELLDDVAETIANLRKQYRVMVITKGDLFDQESKIARSGLADSLWKIEIVSEKDEPTYRRILATHGIHPSEFVMVGNSVRSDILPVVAIGARAVHVPYHLTWAHETAELDGDVNGTVWTLESIRDLPGLLQELADSG